MNLTFIRLMALVAINLERIALCFWFWFEENILLRVFAAKVYRIIEYIDIEVVSSYVYVATICAWSVCVRRLSDGQ